MANTGRVEKQQRDVNPQSPTYGQLRWVDAGRVDLVACPLPASFRSAAISEQVTKNDCPSGQFPSSVTYTLAAGSYTSQASQADADQQARTYFDASKQQYANDNGTCQSTNPGTMYQPLYDENGCFTCIVYNPNDPAETRAANQQEFDMYYVARGQNNRPCPYCA